MHNLPLHVVPAELLRTRGLLEEDGRWKCTHVVVSEEGRGSGSGDEQEEQRSAIDVISCSTACLAVGRCAPLPQPWSVEEVRENFSISYIHIHTTPMRVACLHACMHVSNVHTLHYTVMCVYTYLRMSSTEGDVLAGSGDDVLLTFCPSSEDQFWSNAFWTHFLPFPGGVLVLVPYLTHVTTCLLIYVQEYSRAGKYIQGVD